MPMARRLIQSRLTGTPIARRTSASGRIPAQVMRSARCASINRANIRSICTTPITGICDIFNLSIHQSVKEAILYRLGLFVIDFSSRAGGRWVSGTADSPQSRWQDPYGEHLIGTVHRDGLDRMLIFGEAHLGRALSSYAI